jgi:hypothetical protein
MERSAIRATIVIPAQAGIHWGGGNGSGHLGRGIEPGDERKLRGRIWPKGHIGFRPCAGMTEGGISARPPCAGMTERLCGLIDAGGKQA